MGGRVALSQSSSRVQEVVSHSRGRIALGYGATASAAMSRTSASAELRRVKNQGGTLRN